ncbi:MAG: ParB/RepB/Spo0J family partition protein [Alphaproteobacteria bacterium]|nr:ParB/RepB/Spo0J family partition protein [Alphaproteobacteria bacterium]MCD8566586.1 ParB/RepB/Spo0J family partition protein [Alphaproteobacteria bacterium]
MPLPDEIISYFKTRQKMEFADRVDIYNAVTDLLKEMMEIDHPVLSVKLVKAQNIQSNDYNPNKVAPPEMDLLELSMAKDGVTMPVVAAKNDKGQYVIVDGHHRVQVIKYFLPVYKALRGHVPIVELNKSIAERIAATVRHNMARGSHQTGLSARLVGLLKNHNWTDEKIAKELGMDAEEVLRLKQLTGLAEAFEDHEFSKAWE